jgi:hypothetical protein
MADHLRRQIRDAIATAVTGLATTGARVYTSRVHPLTADELPGLRIMTQSELVGDTSLGAPRVLERRLRLTVHAIAQALDTLDDTLDQICKEVEVALAMPCAALANLAKSITLVATDIDMSGDAERPVGIAAMTYEVFYMTAENAPDVAL